MFINILVTSMLFSQTTIVKASECQPPPGFLSDSTTKKMNDRINYLGCLHNEQNRQINDLIGQLRQLRDEVDRINMAIEE